MAVFFILPQLGGTRQPKEMLSEKAFVLELTESRPGAWDCRQIECVHLSDAVGLVDEHAKGAASGSWIVQLDEVAIHWLGFVPGDKALTMTWRPVFALEAGGGEVSEFWSRLEPPTAVQHAIRAHVESELLPHRDFPMARLVSDEEINEAEPLVWGASTATSHPTTKWAVLRFALAAVSGAGYAVAYLVVPPSMGPREQGIGEGR